LGEGAFDSAHLRAAADRWKLDGPELEALARGQKQPHVVRSRQVLSLAERYDRLNGTDWSNILIRSIARWCAAWVSEGGNVWKLHHHQQGLFASWKEAAAADRTMELLGLKGWRKWISRLPDQPATARSRSLRSLPVSETDLFLYLYRLLGGVYGWASYFRRADWNSQTPVNGPLLDLLAIRVCSEAALSDLLPFSAQPNDAIEPTGLESPIARLALQDALEDGYALPLLRSILPPPATTQTPARPAAQAVFCIDVRSELIRRHLEAQSSHIQTVGFAGFFGVAIHWQGEGQNSARCPVLLNPSITARPYHAGDTSAVAAPLKHLQNAPPAAFSYVELAGALYGGRLLSDMFALSREALSCECHGDFGIHSGASNNSMPLETRIALASGILKNTGLGSDLAPLVLLCGHEGRSENNPHAAGLDCGACGGHGGGLNARVACAILNDPAVRNGLKAVGTTVPQDTWFVAGVHDTSIDQVRILDDSAIPPSHRKQLSDLTKHLALAGEGAREERAGVMGVKGNSSKRLFSRLWKRARDWSEVRPEWALARNAAFIAARRERTRGVNLGGRTFLHDYDCRKDADDSILTLILTAPMVVASWINLQYFASTVDNAVFGSGDKALHNRVGTAGVVLGNGGDLRTGLPMQSVHSREGEWFHEPLRLQVIVETATDRLDAVLTQQAGVRALVENGWVRLVALHPDGLGASLRLSDGSWEPMQRS
jgi:uncharacterized protein YbcC (UPF0753/DUF2309 family)